MKWIECKDRLPAPGVAVLTLDRFRHVHDRKLRKIGAVNVFYPDGLIPGTHITHWMPMPPFPMEG